MNPCSCGTTAIHVIATRILCDGATLIVWSTGLVEIRDDWRTTYLPTTRERALEIADRAAVYDAAEAWALVHWSSRGFLRRVASLGVVQPAARSSW